MRVRLQAAVPALLVIAGACVDGVQPVSPRSGLVDDPTVTVYVNPPSNEALAAVAESFGGFYLDEAGNPTVFLGDAADRGAVVGVLRPYLVSRGLNDAAVRVVRGDYAFEDLNRWFDEANAAFDLPGVHLVDMDEARNRVVVGVDHPGAKGLVRATLARGGIPEGALIVEEREPIKPMVGLRDVWRPTAGGIQINFGGFVCTLGFNATDAGQASFITNSHCTNTQGGVEGTVYYQPSSTTQPSAIATEVEDPAYLKSACPRTMRGKKCRNSDASRAVYQNGVTGTLGLIKRTTGPNNNSLDVAGEFSITGEIAGPNFTVGQVVNKIGRTTGWTRGAITATCVNTGVSGSSIVQLCQTHVAAGVAGGDSGSPTFIDAGNNNATLIGILWGGGTNSFVFSPLANIRQEIGNIAVR